MLTAAQAPLYEIKANLFKALAHPAQNPDPASCLAAAPAQPPQPSATCLPKQGWRLPISPSTWPRCAGTEW